MGIGLERAVFVTAQGGKPPPQELAHLLLGEAVPFPMFTNLFRLKHAMTLAIFPIRLIKRISGGFGRPKFIATLQTFKIFYFQFYFFPAHFKLFLGFYELSICLYFTDRKS